MEAVGLILYLIATVAIWGILYLMFLHNTNLIANVVIFVVIFGIINTCLGPAGIIGLAVIMVPIAVIVWINHHAHEKAIVKQDVQKQEAAEAQQQENERQAKEQQRREVDRQFRAQKEREQRVEHMYHTLGCQVNCNFNEVRIQYRKLMQKYNYKYNDPHVSEIDRCYHELRERHNEEFMKKNDLGDF